jgi:hypothetical protein
MYKRGCLPGTRATEVADDTTLSENVLEKGRTRERLGTKMNV